MRARYVVVLLGADNPYRAQAFGVFQTKETAESFAAKVNEEVERREDADFEMWRRIGEEGSMAPDGYGRAGVLAIRRPNRGAALAFALDEDGDQ